MSFHWFNSGHVNNINDSWPEPLSLCPHSKETVNIKETPGWNWAVKQRGRRRKYKTRVDFTLAARLLQQWWWKRIKLTWIERMLKNGFELKKDSKPVYCVTCVDFLSRTVSHYQNTTTARSYMIPPGALAPPTNNFVDLLKKFILGVVLTRISSLLLITRHCQRLDE